MRLQKQYPTAFSPLTTFSALQFVPDWKLVSFKTGNDNNQYITVSPTGCRLIALVHAAHILRVKLTKLSDRACATEISLGTALGICEKVCDIGL